MQDIVKLDIKNSNNNLTNNKTVISQKYAKLSLDAKRKIKTNLINKLMSQIGPNLDGKLKQKNTNINDSVNKDGDNYDNKHSEHNYNASSWFNKYIKTNGKNYVSNSFGLEKRSESVEQKTGTVEKEKNTEVNGELFWEE
ncbi:MAG: hypothetical protein JJW01_03255 [Alphaproteobacteria bacterium]|nr:hypothetical protein [Rickettsiales bacterium]